MEAIKRGIEQNQKLKDAEQYAKRIEGIGRATNWFESRDKFQKRHELELQNKRIREELRLGKVELVKRRRQQLTRLYEAENAQYQAQLSARGLAIMKIRL